MGTGLEILGIGMIELQRGFPFGWLRVNAGLKEV